MEGYALINRWFTSYMEKSECRVKFSSRQAALDGWIRMTVAMMMPDSVKDVEP